MFPTAAALPCCRISLPATFVPDNAAAGIPDVEMSSWLVVLAPAGTPGAVVAQLNRGIVEAIAEPDVRAKIEGLGAVTASGTPAEVDAFLRTETAKWKPVIEGAAIRIE